MAETNHQVLLLQIDRNESFDKGLDLADRRVNVVHDLKEA